MDQQKPRLLSCYDQQELLELMTWMGVDKRGAALMVPKGHTELVCFDRVKSQTANVLKQEMLSLGGDAAIHRGVVTFKEPETALLLIGTPKQYQRLGRKLQYDYFNLRNIGTELKELFGRLHKTHLSLTLRKRNYPLGKKTLIMGILNITQDSFYDGGRYIDLDRALQRALDMVKEGADIIDVGGESTRPGSLPISEKEELARVLPFVKALRKKCPVPVSIDTTKASVARACLKAGAALINDTSALQDDSMMKKVAASFKVPVVLMHRQGVPRTMQKNPVYKSVVGDIIHFLQNRVEEAKLAGIPESRIIVDPGIGFGKTFEQNLIILKHLGDFKTMGLPILIGSSRKAFIGHTLGLPVEERLEGTAAAAAAAILQGAHILRVHDIKEISRVARVCDAIKNAGPLGTSGF